MEHTTFAVGNEGREVFWNAQSFELILFAFTAVAMIIFAYGVYRRWKMWKAMGKEEIRWDQLPQRLKSLFVNGFLLAMLRRYIIRPERLAYKEKSDNTADDAIALLLIAGIIVTGFLIESLRIYVTDPSWEEWSFVGWGSPPA